MTNAVAKKQNTAVSTESAFDAFAGEGYGEVSASDFIIPRIGVLGDLSPQTKKNKAEYIEGAEVGDLVDIALGEILAKGLGQETFDFLPVCRVKEALRWRPRTSGGGLVGRDKVVGDFDAFAREQGANPNDKREYFFDDGDELIETHQYYGINLSSDMRWSFIPMKKSNLKIARKWFTKATSIKLPSGNQAPFFYKTYKIGSFLDSGNGNEWPNWTVSDGPLLQDYSDDWEEILQAATRLKEAIDEGDASGDVNGFEGEETPDDGKF